MSNPNDPEEQRPPSISDYYFGPFRKAVTKAKNTSQEWQAQQAQPIEADQGPITYRGAGVPAPHSAQQEYPPQETYPSQKASAPSKPVQIDPDEERRRAHLTKLLLVDGYMRIFFYIAVIVGLAIIDIAILDVYNAMGSATGSGF